MRQKVILLTLLLALLIGMITPYVVAALAIGYIVTQPTSPDPRAEYYRGVFDVCSYQTRQPELCLKVMPGYVEKRWFEDPSPGWEWPLPSAPPTPERPARNLDRQGLQNG